MKLRSLALGIAFALGAAGAAQADLKCGDAPYALGDHGLVVSWIGPVPRDAKVRYADGDLLETLDRQFGPGIPRDWPEKYMDDLRMVDVSNSQISTSVEEAAAWLERFDIALEDGPFRVFQNYLDEGKVLFSTLVDHPRVEVPRDFVQCSIILQRAILVMADGRETIHLRSYFHSTDGKGNAVNFAPAGSLRISFASEEAWFPLALTQFITEPASYVVLDLVTARPWNVDAPEPFQIVSQGKLESGPADFYVTRLYGVLEGGREWSDLSIPDR